MDEGERVVRVQRNALDDLEKRIREMRKAVSVTVTPAVVVAAGSPGSSPSRAPATKVIINSELQAQTEGPVLAKCPHCGVSVAASFLAMHADNCVRRPTAIDTRHAAQGHDTAIATGASSLSTPERAKYVSRAVAVAVPFTMGTPV